MCRSYSDLNFGVTFLEHKISLSQLQTMNVEAMEWNNITINHNLLELWAKIIPSDEFVNIFYWNSHIMFWLLEPMTIGMT